MMLGPNQREVAATTAGISRNMQSGLDPFGAASRNVTPSPFGGGDLNGSAATLFLGQAGTAGVRIAVPRENVKAGGGNFCGIV